MSSNRKRSAATAFGDEVYVLVQFVEDSVREIVKKSAIRKRDDGLNEAPYGKEFYICTILVESDDKEEIMRKKHAMDDLTLQKGSKKNTRPKLCTMEKGNLAPAEAGNKKKKENTEKEKKTEGKDKEKVERLKKKEEKEKENEEKRKKKEEKEKEKAEKQKKKEEKEKEKERKKKEREALSERDNTFLDKLFKIYSPDSHYVSSDEVDITSTREEIDQSMGANQAEGNAGSFNVNIVEDAVQLLSRPTTGGKQPRKVHHPPQAPSKQPRKFAGNRVVPTQLDVVPAAECQRCIELKRQVEILKQQLEQANSQNIPSQPPRPGVLPLETAVAFNMVELSPGSRVFVYQTSIDVASSKSPSGAACFLLSCFFSNSELVGSNLSGANGKKQLNPQIIDAIVSFVTHKGEKKSSVRSVLRNKITSLEVRLQRTKLTSDS